MRLRIIDLDGSVTRQPPLAAAADDGLAQTIDLRAQAGAYRILARRCAMRRLGATLDAAGPPPGRGPEATFFGSSDFHHLSAALIARSETPLTIVHFDNHPDWVRFPPTFNCGAWINRALELPDVAGIVTIGVTSDDLVRPQLKSANLAAIAQGRLRVYPWRHAPSRIYGAQPPLRAEADVRHEAGHFVWRNLADESWTDFLHDLADSIATAAIWITIDKDVLGTDEAVTNWDQGGMPLAHIEQALQVLAATHRIVGVDICGDWSKPAFDDPFRATLAWFDHPPARIDDGADIAVNARTNARILDTLRAVL